MITTPSGLVLPWGQDQDVAQLITHLDQRQDRCWDEDSKRYRIELLPKSEYEEVIRQIGDCQADFSYAARNYFQIVTKKGEEIPFALWESQDLVLEIMMQMKAQGKTQRIYIIKARQLGMSTLIEALIAWRCMFFPNARGIVVSDDQDNSAELFSKMLHIYDHMPWWLQPMLDRRKEEKLLVFDNPDDARKRSDPGLQSRVSVQAATKMTGVGQGRSLNCCHLSEMCDWPDWKAVEIIQEDIHNAIAEDVDTFAFLESTAKGAGRYAHKLWRRQVEMGENCQWYPLFLPWFMEKTRVKAPSRGWRPDQRSQDTRERASRDWAQCTKCGAYREQGHSGDLINGALCWQCKSGVLESVVLTDKQLYWMHNEYANVAIDQKSKKTLKQEMALTSEEAFQISGYQIFPEPCIEFVNSSIDKHGFLEGHFDGRGEFHAMTGERRPDGSIKKRCRVNECPYDHAEEVNSLRVWEEPIPGYQYVVGGDVAEGLGGDADYSVAWVNRIGTFGNPDVHVATFRSNEIDPIAFGDVLNFIGIWYNEALMSVEVNKFDSCFTRVRQFHMYSNNYRWKHVDSTNMLTNKWGWWTTQTTKPRLWQTAVQFLRQRLWIIRDEQCYEEMLTFQKESPEDRGASAEDNFNDDTIMAAMIALYTAHDMDWDENQQSIPTMSKDGLIANDQWIMRCQACDHQWSASNPSVYRRCPSDKAGPQRNQICGSIKLVGRFIAREGASAVTLDLEAELNDPGKKGTEGYVPSYEEL